MRLGVLDIGSNTGHLLVVDAYRGAAPIPASLVQGAAAAGRAPRRRRHRHRRGRRRADRVRRRGAEAGRGQGLRGDLSFATSAVREAGNGDEVSPTSSSRPASRSEVLPGEDEARLTFLAVRRWFGWSSGRLAVFDIGGGSLEIAGGDDEVPDVAWSRAARGRPAGPRALRATGRRRRRTAPRAAQADPRAEIARDAGSLLRGGAPDHAVATSKTFRSLARICGAAPSSEGLFVRRILPADELAELDPEAASTMDVEEVAELPGVSREPRPPGAGRGPGGRGGDGHLRPRGARDLPLGAARGRHPRPSRPARRAGLRPPQPAPLFALSTASVYPEPPRTPSTTPSGSATTPSR